MVICARVCGGVCSVVAADKHGGCKHRVKTTINVMRDFVEKAGINGQFIPGHEQAFYLQN